MNARDFITLAEAAHILGVSRMKITRLVKEGVLRVETNLLDKREKLVSRHAVESLTTRRAKAA